jgi:thymidylate kinase
MATIERIARPDPAIPALREVLDDLARRGIRYCSWKSNEHLREALEGRTDLDLLVHADDLVAFRAVVAEHGLKRLVPPPRADFPGMEHHLGFDDGSGRLFHLHVHDRLVLGERYVKNHRIPLEAAFLRTNGLLDGVPVPEPALELGVLAVRVLLKYRPRDAVKDVLGIRTPGITEPMAVELRWLLALASVEEVAGVDGVREALPVDVVTDFLRAFVHDARDGATFFLLRGRLRRELRVHRRVGRVRATARSGIETWARRRRFRRRPPELGMRPANGGVAIAIVGADGAGKTTITAEIGRWLRWKLRVDSFYMGSKEPSVASRAAYLAFRATRRGGRAVASRLGGGSPLQRLLEALGRVALASHHLANAHDRLRRYREGSRSVRDGRVVLFDRFPLEAISSRDDHRLLDGPEIERALGPVSGRVAGWLARREERLYRRFSLTDRLIVLEVTPQVALERKPDHRAEVVERKSRAATEIAELATSRAYRGLAGREVVVSRVDADAPMEVVLREVKARVWDGI